MTRNKAQFARSLVSVIVLGIVAAGMYHNGAPTYAMYSALAMVFGSILMASASFRDANYRSNSFFRFGNAFLLSGLLVLFVWYFRERG